MIDRLSGSRNDERAFFFVPAAPNLKIFLALDDRLVAELVIAGLTENGHSDDHVTDGREAMSYCLNNTLDLVVLDRMMPGLDGL
jgi:two-component system OmpR family response regulator